MRHHDFDDEGDWFDRSRLINEYILGQNEISNSKRYLEKYSPNVPKVPPHPKHNVLLTLKGDYKILIGAGSTIYTPEENVTWVSLNGDVPQNLKFGQPIKLISACLQDYGGVPENWEKFINKIADTIYKQNTLIAAFCTGGHGRTGTFAASLLGLMNPDIEDPIASLRACYCEKAVETEAQARAVFKVSGKSMPSVYKETKRLWKGFDETKAHKVPAL